MQPNAVQNLGMAFHELGTNSSKYGALASDAGRLEITWQIATSVSGKREIHLVWDETMPVHAGDRPGGRQDESPRKGFGTVVLQRVAPQSLNGSAVLERSPGHLSWSLTAPLESIIVPQLGAEMPAAESPFGP